MSGSEFVGYFSALILGALMGSVGGGGAILSVPVFVYAFGIAATQATQYSLWVVAVAAVVGVIPYWRAQQVQARLALMLGLPSFAGVIVGRRLIVPALPSSISFFGWGEVSRDRLLMGVFALLMLFAARAMLRAATPPVSSEVGKPSRISLVFQGVSLGLVTGILGAGGGFLIVPLLVGAFRLPMKAAVGTSLLMIAMNSALGFGLGLVGSSPMDWRFLALFTLIALVGIQFGVKVSRRFSGDTLKRAFAFLVLLLGVGVLANVILS